MCGRFARFTPQEVYSHLFRAHGMGNLAPRYNIAPSQAVLVARNLEGDADRELAMLRWGLIPPWAKGPKDAHPINARAETAHEKLIFRKALAQRRCLVAADGFYEWKREGRRKQPYFIRLKGGEPFGIAGIWDRWAPPEGEAVPGPPPPTGKRYGFVILRSVPDAIRLSTMNSSSVQIRSLVRKRQWWCVLALFVGAAALGLFGVSTILLSCIVAVGAVWGSILLATEPPVVRRVPNLRGAIVLTGLVTALGLGFYVVNTWHSGGHAHAMESTVSSR